MEIVHGGRLFQFAAARGVRWQEVLDCSASINPLGPSPRVFDVIRANFETIAHYPDRDSRLLNLRLAREWGIEPDQIVTGNGATDLLRDFCHQHGNGLIAVPAFGEFHRFWPDAGLCRLDRPETWPVRGALVLTNPANPTGGTLEDGVVLDHLKRTECTILIDESFIEFSRCASLVTETIRQPRLLVLRSLTKFYALPGLRVGALVAHPAALASVKNVRPPWSVNILAEAGALAALDDREHATKTRVFVQAERGWLQNQLSTLPFSRVWDSDANYLYVETAAAAEVVERAADRLVLVRDCSRWPGMERPSIRVAVRQRHENERLLSALRL